MIKKKKALVAIAGGALICVGVWLAAATIPKSDGIRKLKVGDYNGALTSFDTSLLRLSTVDTMDLKKLAESCIKITDDYNNNDFNATIVAYESIKNSPNFSYVKNAIDPLYVEAKRKPNLVLTYPETAGAIILHVGSDNVVEFELTNSGVEAAEGLVLNFKFTNMTVDLRPTIRWCGLDMQAGTELWREIRYTPGETVHRGVPLKFTLPLTNSRVSPDAKMVITIAAKDCDTQEITVPVKLRSKVEEGKNSA